MTLVIVTSAIHWHITESRHGAHSPQEMPYRRTSLALSIWATQDKHSHSETINIEFQMPGVNLQDRATNASCRIAGRIIAPKYMQGPGPLKKYQYVSTGCARIGMWEIHNWIAKNTKKTKNEKMPVLATGNCRDARTVLALARSCWYQIIHKILHRLYAAVSRTSSIIHFTSV